jgi:hypothetical protein
VGFCFVILFVVCWFVVVLFVWLFGDVLYVCVRFGPVVCLAGRAVIWGQTLSARLRLAVLFVIG